MNVGSGSSSFFFLNSLSKRGSEKVCNLRRGTELGLVQGFINPSMFIEVLKDPAHGQLSNILKYIVDFNVAFKVMAMH